MPRNLLTVDFHDQADGGTAAAIAAVVVELQPVRLVGSQAGDRLRHGPGALGKADLVAVRRGAVVVERPADVDAGGTGPGLDRAVVRPSGGGRMRLETGVHHKSRTLGQEDGIADADTRVDR